MSNEINIYHPKKLMYNTLMLYIRMIITNLCALYTVRIVLRELGVDDYGIYTLIAGIVTLFSFVMSSIQTAAQRFFTIEITKPAYGKLSQYFNTSFLIYLIFAVSIVIIAELIGNLVLLSDLNIPPSRLNAARWVFHFSVLTFCFKTISILYESLFIAFERFDIYAYLSLFDSVFKIVLASILTFIPYDKLIIYAFFVFISSLLTFVVYYTICNVKYKICKLNFRFDKKILRTITSFSGWTILGASAQIGKVQGNNILINLAYGPALNAAKSLADQIGAVVNLFVSNFSQAIKVQITRDFARENFRAMDNLVVSSSKICFYIMLCVVVPLVLFMPEILKLWLGEVPASTIPFTRLALLNALVESVAYPVTSAIVADGRMKKYQIMVATILLANLPLSFLFLKMGYSAQVVYIISICVSVVLVVSKFYVYIRYFKVKIRSFIKSIIFPILFVLLLVAVALCPTLMLFGVKKIILITLFAVIVSISIVTVGLTKSEFQNIKKLIKRPE